jgi:SAM-dependent methyltransferase
MLRAKFRRVRGRVFGGDPGAYHRARLGYPPRVYEILTQRCGLRPGATVFEIGPGTGIATRELLRHGASRITVFEPDRRLVRFLRETLGARGERVEYRVGPFERAALPAGRYDLGIAASSFHWTPERLALRKVARALRPGGWWAMWNNHHGDPPRIGPFPRAIQPLYRALSTGRSREEVAPAGAVRERRERLDALRSLGRFDRVSREEIRWKVALTTSRVQSLWGSFSDTILLPPAKRRWFLTELGRIVDDQFGGRVEVPIRTPIYTARRI